MFFFQRSCPIEIVKLRKGQWKTSRFMTKQLCNLKESSQGHISSFLRDSNLSSFFSFPLNRNLTFFLGGGESKKIGASTSITQIWLVAVFVPKGGVSLKRLMGCRVYEIVKHFKIIQNGGTEPCKAIWGMGFPLHRPYIQLIYSRCPPPLGTWNVWWWDESLPRFRSTTSITKTAAKITWNGRSLFGCSCFCADKKSWVKKGKQNWAYPKKRKMTVCFFKAGGGYISSFGTNWLKLTWTSKSHFVWHGVFTSLLISVERRWSQSCFRNSTFPLTCGLTGTIEHLQKLETNKVHPSHGSYIQDQLIFIYISLKVWPVSEWTSEGVIIFWWPHR